MELAALRNIAAYLKGVFALIPAVIVAGAGNDNVVVSGPWITLIASNVRYSSAVLYLLWSTTLAANKTLTLTANLQDATDISGTGAANYGTVLAATAVANGGGGGATVTGVTQLPFDLTGCRGFVRAQVTADLSAASVDTVALSGILVLHMADNLPAS